MPQSENNMNIVLFLQEHKNSIMVKQWTFYPPNRGIGTLEIIHQIFKNKIVIFDVWWIILSTRRKDVTDTCM